MEEVGRLELSRKLHQVTLLPGVQRVKRGERLSAPLIVDLDPTTFCDLACPECVSASVLATKQFSTARLKGLARELSDIGVRGVILIGGGEPLLHPGVEGTIRILGDAGIRIGLVTNGTLLHRYKTVIQEHVSWVRVSIDAGTSRTYELFRPSRRGQNLFDSVLRNTHDLCNSGHTAVGYSYVVMTRACTPDPAISNIAEVYQAGTLAKQIGCRYFELKAMMRPDHFVSQLQPELLGQLRSQVDLLKSLEEDWFNVLYSSSMKSLLAGEGEFQTKLYQSCRVAELRTLITPTGVYVCSYHRGKEWARLGDARVESFAEIWARADRKVVNPSRDCPFHCARHSSNLELHSESDESSASETAEYDVFI